MSTESRYELIREWAEQRGLYAKGDVKTQYVKLGEEFGELGKSIIKDNSGELVDSIGDMVVVLTNLAHLAGFKIEDCIDVAYDEIKSRKGSMINGSFVKDGSVEFVKVSERMFRYIGNNGNESSLLGLWGFEIGKEYREIEKMPSDIVLLLEVAPGKLHHVPANNFELVNEYLS